MREFKLAAIQRLKMGASATEVARAFAVNPNVLHRWWREFHLRPGNAWASGLDDPRGRTTRCLLETDMTRKDREAMSNRLAPGEPMIDLPAARSQMAISLAFHIIFAVVGIGMPVLADGSVRHASSTDEPRRPS